MLMGYINKEISNKCDNMRFRILILICIMLIVLTISAVSAEDNITSSDDEKLETYDVNNLSQSSGTFSDIQHMIDSAPNAEIDLEPITYVGSGTHIIFTKSITINGHGAILDAKSSSEIFAMKNKQIKAQIIVKDITFKNGKHTEDYGNGGAIFGGDSNKCFIVYNCVFENCGAKNYGGAISGGTAYYSTFKDCYCGEDGGAIRYGDAINCNFINCKADDTVFKSNNDHRDSGGAIDNGNAINCNFTNCVADKFGGAINEGNAENCNFINCKCGDRDPTKDLYINHWYIGTGDGGAIHKGTAKNCRFINCHSENYGGAIAVGKAINCYFEKCSSHKDGGAISTTTAIKCVFKNCKSDSDGGAMDRGEAQDCQFINCHADKYGGAIYHGSATNCVFTGNSADCGGAMSGGTYATIHNGVHKCTAKKCKFIKNTAKKYGGALYGVKHVSCKFNKNSASWKGKNVQNFASLKKVKVKKSAAKLVLTATILRHPGYKVIFKFNGKTYKSKVIKNRKTPAKVTIKSSALKKLKVGKKVKYSATYLEDTVERSVKVKK